MKHSPAQILLEKHLTELNLQFQQEYRFALPRKWAFDYILINHFLGKPIAIEIEGGIYTQGRHTRGKGYEADLAKYNEAAKLGWTVFRFSTGQVLRGDAKKFLAAWLAEWIGK